MIYVHDLTEQQINSLAQRFYETSGIRLQAMTDKPRVVIGLKAVFSELANKEAAHTSRMDANLAVMEYLDNIPDEERGGHLGGHASRIVDLALAHVGIPVLDGDE